MKRATYLRHLRELIPAYGSDNIIYFDESGFEEDVRRDAGWAERGQKIYGDVRGGKNPRTNLIMAQRRKSRQWLAPILFEGSCESTTVLWWIKNHLLASLTKPSVIVMDNAPFHPKAKIKNLLEEKGHKLLCLPKYSPDLNPIEQTFAAMKTKWKNAQQDTKLDTIVTSNC
jgi:putative transposase